MAALAEAGTQVCQPIDRFELEVPDELFGPVVSLLGRLGAVTLETSAAGGYTRLVGHLPAKEVPSLAARLPDLTSGEGVLVTRLDHHAPVTSGGRRDAAGTATTRSTGRAGSAACCGDARRRGSGWPGIPGQSGQCIAPHGQGVPPV